MKRLHISSSEAHHSRLGEVRYIHEEKNEISAAFYINEPCVIELRVPRVIGADAAFISLFSEDGAPLLKSEFEFTALTEGDDVYSTDVPLSVGLFFFTISINTVSGLLSVKKCDRGVYFSEKEEPDFFQLSISEAPASKKSSYLGGIIYHIFVDRFSKDEAVIPKKGAILAEDWSRIPEYPEYPGAPMKNNTFYGGTLRSAAKRLDYIRSLGANIVYLSPIFESPSNHKYDTADYLKVDEMFGGDEALRYFLDEAKKRGIGVILDGVFNHTGADSVYFNRYGTYDTLGAYQSKESDYYNWYTFEKHPDKYVCWWGIEILPRINTGNSNFEKFILNKVIKKYRDMGILGLRLDVADELSDDFIKKIKSSLSEDGESLLYGEVWEDASNKIAYGKRKTYYLGRELDGVMNYPLRDGILDYILNKKTDKLNYALREVTQYAPKHIRNMQMNVLGTHDTVRILTALGTDGGQGRKNSELASLRMTPDERDAAEAKLKAAYTVIATLPGIPSVFYGDEAGLEGYSDPFNRMPYPKDVSESLLEHYKKIGKIRRSAAVYRDGEFELITLTPELLAFLRARADAVYLTVYNNSSDAYTIDFEQKTKELVGGQAAARHTVLPHTAAIFKSSKINISNLI